MDKHKVELMMLTRLSLLLLFEFFLIEKTRPSLIKINS